MTTRTQSVPALLGTALLGLTLLSGCTGDDEPKAGGTPSGTSSSDATPSGSVELKDRSSEVLANPPTLTSIATTKAKGGSSFAGSTFTVYALTRSDTSTILTYSVTGGSGSSTPTDSLPRSWEKAPSLITPTQAFRVVTFQQESKEWASVANPIYRIKSGQESGPLDVLYPPLPKGTTSVKITGPWFEDVTVPVTELSANS